MAQTQIMGPDEQNESYEEDYTDDNDEVKFHWKLEMSCNAEEMVPTETDKPHKKDVTLETVVQRDKEKEEIFLEEPQATETEQKCILELASTNIASLFNKRQWGDVAVSNHIIGSAVYLKWVSFMIYGHLVHKWCSQPLLNRRMHSGDLLISAAVLLSGNNYQKIQLLANILKMPLVSSTTFHKIQRSYLIPVVADFWEILRNIKEKM
ncbi:unnamed protein product [Mytilus edulis]|uniref:Uncharacterized protein n=1 Tax=Mytilus edulis TaxID=6550 RepID=A0A8S3T736_MYTED|nr:unnamed protein product [Mytilus edulis]